MSRRQSTLAADGTNATQASSSPPAASSAAGADGSSPPPPMRPADLNVPLPPRDQAKVERLEAAIGMFFEDQELEVPDLDVALQAREALSDLRRFLRSVVKRYPTLFQQDVELLEEKLEHVLREAEDDDGSGGKPPPCPCTNTGVAVALVWAAALLVVMCLALALAVVNQSGVWALVGGLCAVCLFLLGMGFLVCLCQCYRPPEKDGDAMYEFGIRSHGAAGKKTDSISL